MATIDEVAAQVAVLEKKLDQALRGLTLLARHLGALPGNGGGAQTSGPKPPLVATDDDLDGSHGDPQVKFNPKSWVDQGGEDFKGTRLSLCSAEFLDCYAEALEWCSENPKPGKEKYAKYDKADAARARGWAMRVRGQNVPTGDDGKL